VNFTAVYEDVVAVGAYDTINSSIWPTSSRGPSISGLSKPDLVAPGVNIIAPYPGNKYAKLTGTAAAGAHVSGAVALFLQYILVDGNYPDKAFVQKIRTYLSAGAKRESQIVYPNQSYGYGELDIRGMFDQLK
jgi:subtilisin family serine protease